MTLQPRLTGSRRGTGHLVALHGVMESLGGATECPEATHDTIGRSVVDEQARQEGTATGLPPKSALRGAHAVFYRRSLAASSGRKITRLFCVTRGYLVAGHGRTSTEHHAAHYWRVLPRRPSPSCRLTLPLELISHTKTVRSYEYG